MRIYSKNQYDTMILYLNPKQRYRLYLRTTHWVEVRNTVHQFYKNKCDHCHRHLTLSRSNVHHLNYDHQWEEVPGRDVILLCKACHNKVHHINQIIENQHTRTRNRKRKWTKKDYKRAPIREFMDISYTTMRKLIHDLESNDSDSIFKYDTKKLNELIMLIPDKKDYIINLMRIKR